MAKSVKKKKKKTVAIAADSIRNLQEALGVATASRAVQIAVEDRLAAEELFAAEDRIIKRQGIADVYRRARPAGNGKK